jgi:hypothetical protein
MVDNQSKASIKTESQLPTPLFDDSATAKAQPVEPISRSRFSNWFGKQGSVRRLITTRSRALSLVVIAGLATGTLGGMALVSHSQADQATANEAVFAQPNQDGQLDFETAEVGARGLLVTGDLGRRHKIRARQRTGGGLRAYRVAVIR